jgi:hypothetical protein
MLRLTLALALSSVGLPSAAQDPVRPQLREEATGECRARIPLAFEGLVLDRAGAVVSGAVVVSSAGSRTVTDEGGFYRLLTNVPAEAEAIQVMAVGGEDGSARSGTLRGRFLHDRRRHECESDRALGWHGLVGTRYWYRRFRQRLGRP